MRASTALLTCTAILVLFAGFVFVSRGAGARSGGGTYWDDYAEGYIRRRVANSYVDTIDVGQGRDAFYRAMNAYVRFDRYSELIPPDRYQRWKDDTRGRYAGLGIKILEVEDGLLLKGVWPGGPADIAGIKVGDTLVGAAGETLAGRDLDDMTRLLKGQPGSVVNVRIVPGPRPESGPAVGVPRIVQVTRGTIRPPTVFERRVGDRQQIAVIRLTDFTQETANVFHAAIKRAVEAAGVEALVLDLRDNGGGVLGVATSIVDRFLARGVIVRMEGRGRDATRPSHATQQPNDVLHLPLVVMVNGRSASASEVVAGALQDHRRAVIVGSRTYGKFLVQSIVEIPKRRAALKLTTSRYYLPSGRSYQGPTGPHVDMDAPHEPVGLLPDVVVELSDDQLLRLRRQWANVEGHFWNEVADYTEVADEEVDLQLQHAVDLIQGGTLLQEIRRNGRARNG